MSPKGAAVARDVRGMLAVAATYVYFLLFAQYGFLRLLESRGAGAADLAPVLGAMGLAGLSTSLAAARWLAGGAARRLLRAGFTGAALAALLALAAQSQAAMLALAVLIGGSTALVTVTLAAQLGALVGRPAFALKIGAATGAAYLFCNVPAVFAGSPALQCVLSALVAALGLAAVPAERPGSPELAPDVPASTLLDYRGLGFLAVVLSFLALIALDSAAFSIIQQSPELKALSWQDPARGWLLGVTHLASAVAAGWLLDRGCFRSLLVSTFALFVVGLGALGGQGPGFVTGAPLYVAGISLYSVALVVYPSRVGELPGLVPTRWRAALLFGVAGWLGSALGVGAAQGLEHIPRAFLAASGSLLAAAWALTARRELLGRFVRAHRITAACGIFGLALYVAGPRLTPPPAGEEQARVMHGREVYVAEGCIHCHSQYVRPATRDVEWWGPSDGARQPRDRPVLIGNRRQGPDLLNVGLRRSARWEELHLRSPRAVSPGSCMPSYAHLFERGDQRGDDLIAYLTTLGAARARERAAYIEAWDASTPARSVEHGARLYDRLCTPCHGTSARGDGPLARELARPGMNLLKAEFWLISWGPGAEPEAEAMARLVKFGASGSTMPGHETLSAEEVADVVAYVRSLRAARLSRRAALDAGGPDPARGG